MSQLETHQLVAEDVPKLFPELADKTDALGWCAFNAAAGPAFIGFINGEPVGMSGLRIFGIAEAWMYLSPGVPNRALSQRISLLRGILERLESLQKERKIWKIWAESQKFGLDISANTMQSEDFLRFAGFKKNDSAFTKLIQEV